MGEKQKKHSRSCAFCLYKVLLAHLAEAHQDCCDFRAGGVVLRIQLAVRTIHDAVGNRPLHCVYSVSADGRSVHEAGERPARRRGTGVAVQHGDELLAGDVGIRVDTVGYALSLRPVHALLVPGRAAGGVRACVARENRHQHTAGGGRGRRELVIADAVHQALVSDVLNRVSVPCGRSNVIKVVLRGLGVLNFAEGRGDRYLAVRHGEGVLVVRLLGDGNGLALCVGNRQLVELIACIRGDGYGNRIALFAVLLSRETLPFDAVDAETVLVGVELEDEPPEE